MINPYEDVNERFLSNKPIELIDELDPINCRCLTDLAKGIGESMKFGKVEIKSNGPGTEKIILDGKELQKEMIITAINLSIQNGEIPMLQIETIADDIDVEISNAQVDAIETRKQEPVREIGKITINTEDVSKKLTELEEQLNMIINKYETIEEHQR